MRKLVPRMLVMELIGSAAAAEKFGVDRATFNRWVANGDIPVAVDLGGRTGARLFEADVIADLARKRQEVAS